MSEIVHAPKAEIETVGPVTPMGLLQMAINREGSIDVIERLAKLQAEMMDREDKIAFRGAITKFKAEMPRIMRSRAIKDKAGNELYKVVALEDVADPVMKALLKQGITYRFLSDILSDGRIKVTCYLALQGTAYEEQGATLAAPPDTAGGKDALKAVGSTTSYLEKYTLMASVGMHVYGSDPEAVKPSEIEAEYLPEATVDDYVDALNQAPDRDSLKSLFAECWAKAKKLNDHGAKERFEKAYEAQKRKLAAQ